MASPHSDIPGSAPPVAHPRQDLAQENLNNMARTISTEARGEGEAAMIAVGWTLRNRMTRDGTSHVNRAWRGYRHGVRPDPAALRIALGILNNTTPDPTDGATHFYTPKIMPKKGQPKHHHDIAGGLESVPGVTDLAGNAIQSYRPGFTLTFDQKSVSGVPESAFKFYRQPGTGRVH